MKQKTTTVPLVMVAVGDPVGTGLVQNLAHPGGNLTELSSIAPDLEGKRLQLLREVAPTLSHVAMFFNSLNPFQIASVRQAVGAAETLGIRLQQLDIQKSEDLDGVFATLRLEQRLPSINAYEELVESGGLMSYGPSYEDMHKRAAISSRVPSPAICQLSSPPNSPSSSILGQRKHSA